MPGDNKTQPCPLLQVSGLSRYFGETVALENVSFSVNSGEISVVLGSNGAGKSTLLSILAGMLSFNKGEIHFLSQTWSRARLEQRRALSYAGERPLLYGNLTLLENLRLVASLSLISSEMEQAVCGILEEFGLQEFKSRKLRHCSQGVMRRAGLARALLVEPKLLVLDEPFANLDLRSVYNLQASLLKRCKSGMSLLLSCHEEEQLRSLEPKVVFLDSGRRRQEIVDWRTGIEFIKRSSSSCIN